MDPIQKLRLVSIDLSIKLIEEQYGEWEDIEYLLELLNLEFPEDNYTIEDIWEWNSLASEISDMQVLYNLIQ